MASATAGEAYPARLDIDYDPGPRQRLTVLFRIILIIPIAVVLATIGGGLVASIGARGTTGLVGGVIVVPTLLMILFRRKYPHWWFAFNLEYSRFAARVAAYALLLTDAYPSTTDEQSVHLELDYPDAEADLNRWLPLVKWLLAIPHFIVLFFLWIAAMVVSIVAWFAILFTGSHPEGLHRFVVGVLRWGLRVEAYAFLFLTDRYPPFSLD